MATTEALRGEIQRSNGSAAAVARGEFTDYQKQVGRFLGLKPDAPSTVALFAVCERYGLDPFMGHIVVMQDRKPYITRDGYLHVAHLSGQLDGIEVEEPVLSEDGTEWRCKATVYRKDMSKPFAYFGRYQAKGGGNQKFAPEMAVKCAESMALRRAFPVTGLGSAEERWDIQEGQVNEQWRAAPQTTREPSVDDYDGADPEVDVTTGEIVED